jgi:hypothetical protein
MKQLAYHIYQNNSGVFVYHEFYFWYHGAGGDDYVKFAAREQAEEYAKLRGGFDAYGY